MWSPIVIDKNLKQVENSGWVYILSSWKKLNGYRGMLKEFSHSITAGCYWFGWFCTPSEFFSFIFIFFLINLESPNIWPPRVMNNIYIHGLTQNGCVNICADVSQCMLTEYSSVHWHDVLMHVDVCQTHMLT